MNENKWKKFKKNYLSRAKEKLIGMEDDYVSACAKFIAYEKTNDPIWMLNAKNTDISGLIINSRNTILPVFFGNKEVPSPGFLKSLMRVKNIHSVQGIKDEVKFMELEIEKAGIRPQDVIDYDLMSIYEKIDMSAQKAGPSGLVLRVPQMADINEMAPLQAAYELEEVIPKGSVLNPAASRVNAENLIAGERILASELDGRLVGKINVNAVSFNRYQIGGVYVHPDYRGRGIARIMAGQFINSLINNGKGVTLFVKKINNAAIRLYSGLGFKKLNDYRISYY